MKYVKIKDLVSVEEGKDRYVIKTFNGDKTISKEEFEKDYVAVKVSHRREIDTKSYGQALEDVYKNTLTPHNEVY